MTLSDFATFTTALSGIAATVSIIYLALQTHQNVKHMRASVTQAMRHPAFREAYESRFKTPGTKFCAFMDDAIAKLPPPA